MHPGHPKSCCGFFFQEKPFFTYQGTCFTTKETVTEFYPASSASIRVWLYMNESASPEFSLLMRGSDAAERQGVVWTLSHEDHPMGVLEKDFNRVDSGKVAAVSITMSEARKIYTCIFLPCIRLIFLSAGSASRCARWSMAHMGTVRGGEGGIGEGNFCKNWCIEIVLKTDISVQGCLNTNFSSRSCVTIIGTLWLQQVISITA